MEQREQLGLKYFFELSLFVELVSMHRSDSSWKWNLIIVKLRKFALQHSTQRKKKHSTQIFMRSELHGKKITTFSMTIKHAHLELQRLWMQMITFWNSKFLKSPNWRKEIK